MVKLPVKNGTIPHEIIGKYKATNVLMKPACPVPASSPAAPVRAIMEAGGVTDVLSKCVGCRSPINIVRAVFDGIEQHDGRQDRGQEPRQDASRICGVNAMAKKIEITLVKSTIDQKPEKRATVRSPRPPQDQLQDDTGGDTCHPRHGQGRRAPRRSQALCAGQEQKKWPTSTCTRPRARPARKRIVGRGQGSGLGTTAGKGNKGQQSRSGGKTYPGFEGGQMPLYRRLPHRGFTNRPSAKDWQIVNLHDIETRFEAGEIVDGVSLARQGPRQEGRQSRQDPRQRRAHQGAHLPRRQGLRLREGQDREGRRQGRDALNRATPNRKEGSGSWQATR